MPGVLLCLHRTSSIVHVSIYDCFCFQLTGIERGEGARFLTSYHEKELPDLRV